VPEASLVRATDRLAAAPLPGSLTEIVLTVQGFSDMLQTCNQNGVSHFKVGDLEVWLGRPQPKPDALVENSTHDAAGSVPTPFLQAPTAAEMEDAELSQALIDDPLAYEQRMIDGHLTRESVNAGSEGRTT
jgi:hypothetical protein